LTHLPRPTLDDLSQPHSVASGNAKQFGPARNEIGFVFMQDTICEHDFPKHLDHPLPSRDAMLPHPGLAVYNRNRGARQTVARREK